MSSEKRIRVATQQKVDVNPAEHLARGWFPVNGTLLRSIKEKLSTGEYDSDPAKLIQELKNDFSLLTYCLKGLKDTEIPNKKSLSPIEFLEKVPIHDLKTVLSTTEGEISSHSFNEMVKPQALRLRHTLISTSTAETIAEKAGIDTKLVFSSALLRQLGLNLVAWNYPRIYSQVLTKVAAGEGELDKLLHRALGFSPKQIALSMVLPNEIPKHLEEALRTEKIEGSNEQASIAARLCDIGETFAMVNDPEHFPGVTRSWDKTVAEINHFLGPNGLSLIKKRLDFQSANYIAVSPRNFDIDISPEKNLEIANFQLASALLNANPHIIKCPDWLKDKFRKVYARVTPGKVSPEALRVLVVDLIPSSGFHRGCIYLADNNGDTLFPKLRIGDSALDDFKVIHCRERSASESAIVDALYSNLPLKQEGAIMHGMKVTHVTGAIGTGDKTGVLYLEMSEDLVGKYESEHILFFKAIRHCLNECLNLA